MRNLLCVQLFVGIFLSGYAWGESLEMKTINDKVKKCVFPKSKKRAPAWVCNAQADGFVLTAVGSAAKSKAGLAFMEQMALADARTHLAQSLSESAQPKAGGNENAANTTASDGTVSTKMVNETLENTKIIKSISGPKGMLYVLIGIDEASAQTLRGAIGANDPLPKPAE